jgi:hypothetical protein
MLDEHGVDSSVFALFLSQESTIAPVGSGQVPRYWRGDVVTEGDDLLRCLVLSPL